MASATHGCRKNATKAVWSLVAWNRMLARSVDLWDIKLHIPSETLGFLEVFVEALFPERTVAECFRANALELEGEGGRDRAMVADVVGTMVLVVAVMVCLGGLECRRRKDRVQVQCRLSAAKLTQKP